VTTGRTHAPPGAPLITTKYHLKAARQQSDQPTGIVIAIADWQSPPRKAARLELRPDGSIFLSSPYYPPSPGVLFKAKQPTVGTAGGLGWMETLGRYFVDVPVKLSIHPSGLVQFSMTGKIRSGMDDAFWLAKGLGIHCPPLWHPIETGPTFGLTMFGLKRCKQWAPQQAKGVRSLIFEEGDFLDREEHNRTYHRYDIQFFIFPAELRREAVYLPEKGWVVFYQYSTVRPDLIVPFRVIDLPISDVFMGILVTRQHIPAEQPGYVMNSPVDLTHQFSIGAGYPAESWGGDSEDLQRLDPPDI
jgi:hypothetical protein